MDIAMKPACFSDNLRRLTLLGAGYVCLGLGTVGLFLPLMPTTIFWIVAALCFSRSSPALRRRVFRQPVIGPIVEEFVDQGVIRPKAKRAAVIGICIAGSISILALLTRPLAAVAVVVILLLVILYVMTRPGSACSD
jgi:uncharacterized membrane protein YbaN (DUF454 family)